MAVEERVAILEEQNRHTMREMAKIEASVEHNMAMVRKDVSDIKNTMSKQKGFWAGVTFVASIIGFLLSQLWSHIKSAG